MQMHEVYAEAIRERAKQAEERIHRTTLGQLMGGPHEGCAEFDPGPSEADEEQHFALQMFLDGITAWADEHKFYLDLPVRDYDEADPEDVAEMYLEESWLDDDEERIMLLVSWGEVVAAAYGAGRAGAVNHPTVKRLLGLDEDE